KIRLPVKKPIIIPVCVSEKIGEIILVLPYRSNYQSKCSDMLG
ncbi:hypothetical protein HMPREF9065_00133, partial [Aggregatibacter sp. oral taxon 458 str. W10330]